MEELKVVLREQDIPFFEDEELKLYLRQNNNDYDKTAYQCLIIKAEDTTLNISGLTAADSSSYFRRIAARYKPRNSGILH
jgi:hypothetical protein